MQEQKHNIFKTKVRNYINEKKKEPNDKKNMQVQAMALKDVDKCRSA